jgi:hypothetical protein
MPKKDKSELEGSQAKAKRFLLHDLFRLVLAHDVLSTAKMQSKPSYAQVSGGAATPRVGGAGAAGTRFSKRLLCLCCFLSLGIVGYIVWLVSMGKKTEDRLNARFGGKANAEFMAAVAIAGLFVLGAITITVHSIRAHYRCSRQPRIRVYTVRILLMIPVYGVEAWLAIVFGQYAVMFKVRDHITA